MTDDAARNAIAGSLMVVAAGLMLVVWLITGLLLNLIAFLCFGSASALYFRRVLRPASPSPVGAPGTTGRLE